MFAGKAVLVVNGGKPRTLSVGERTDDGLRLLAVDQGTALLEVDGKRHTLSLGGQAYVGGGEGPAQTHLSADARGHFLTLGSVNGVNVRFLVDTGASMVSLGAADARRAGIDFRQGRPGATMTANGVARIWMLKLDTVRVGDLTLRDVDAAVHEQDLPVALLGMSFLNRMEMQREGDTLTLKKRY